MKKNTLFSRCALAGSLIGISLLSSAQISISSTDLPSIGLMVGTAEDTTTALSAGNPSSSTQNWNFSTLLTQKSFTTAFEDARSTPYSSAFAAANLADSTYGAVDYNFFITNANYFAVEGSEQIVNYMSLVTIQVEVNLVDLFYQANNLPATYGNITDGVAWGSQTKAQNLIVYDSIRVHIYINYHDTVDAWGTMTTPKGTYNVLRQKHWETDYDSIWLHGTGGPWAYSTDIITYKNQYDWYTNKIGYILAEMDMDSVFGTKKDIIWDTASPTNTGINEISFSGKTTVYPNPCVSQITFSSTDKSEQYLSVYDLAGRQLDQTVMKNGLISLNTNMYPDGLYFYQLTDNSGALLDRGKFTVQK